jgi:putative DNA primase/helicase
VEQLARALFGVDVAEVPPDEKGEVRYPRVARGIRMRNGTGRRVEGNQHPDPRAEAVRWQICEANLIQSGGRGRGVLRTEANPLQIDIVTNVVLPIEVNEVTTWDAIQPSYAEVMRARGAVPTRYRDMAAAYPELFASADAARMALSREAAAATSEQTPIERDVIGVCSELTRARYRLTGERQAGRLLYDPARIDPAAWLTERLGPVTILDEGEPAETEPAAEQENPEQTPAAPAELMAVADELVADAGLGICAGLSALAAMEPPPPPPPDHRPADLYGAITRSWLVRNRLYGADLARSGLVARPPPDTWSLWELSGAAMARAKDVHA